MGNRIRAQRLGLFIPRLGVRSETFIRRHAQDLDPRCVVVSQRGHVEDADWRHDGPLFVLEPSSARGIVRAGMRKARAAATRQPQGRLRLTTRQQHAAVTFLVNHQVTVVMGEYLHPWVDLVGPLRAAGIRFVVHGHGHDLSVRLMDPRWGALYARGYSQVEGIAVPSRYARLRLGAVGVPSKHVHVIPCGVETQPLRTPPVRRAGRLRLLSVGRLVEKKGPLRTLEAIAEAVAQRADVHLDLVGAGPLGKDVQRLVDDRDLSEFVTVHGAVPNDRVLRLMEASDVFVQHSVRATDGDEEGLPVAIIEAMAHGLAVVSTRHAGIPEAVTDGQSGFLVAEHDVAGMAARIVELDGNRELVARMGHAGSSRATAEFTWSTERQRLRDLLEL